MFRSLEPSLERVRARRGVKWARHADALASWVADMDFDPPEVVVGALRTALERGDLGYWFFGDRLQEAFVDWQSRHHGWSPDVVKVRPFTTVLHALETVLWHTTQPDDGVVVFPPIYHPFLHAIGDSGRRRIDVPLDPGEWRIDADRLEGAIDDTTRLILFCNPHNPSGRVFDAEEVSAVAEVAERHDLVVISDEIWADVTFGKPHLPAAMVDERFAGRLVTLSSASKAFNLAGLRCAVAHVDHPPLDEALAPMPGHILGASSSLGVLATITAWEDGEPWLRAARAEIAARVDQLASRVAAMPDVCFTPPEGTYLAFLDLRATRLGETPAERLLADHGLAVSEGSQFGEQGAGWVRINVATTEEILDLVLDRVEAAIG